jgi:hypothetical protein
MTGFGYSWPGELDMMAGQAGLRSLTVTAAGTAGHSIQAAVSTSLSTGGPDTDYDPIADITRQVVPPGGVPRSRHTNYALAAAASDVGDA